ncbi:4Fe-4S binding protein [Adlercreutzia sp. R25]|uniref:4Fe-4S binding protein n=1 Tax=Adlercreutzia shanghongiae TaxID=3111773 RepID=UPI002DB65962|nr:4Fe-4S binding protein [Adlercreutzia sp. R25]MEC4271905.1 4Fe-4S binding protein [Adlercreutzia sp. R25]
MDKKILDEASKISRRGFVTAGALGALGLAGCAPSESEGNLASTGEDAAAEPAAGEKTAWNGVADEVTRDITVKVPGKPTPDGNYYVTFNGGPLTAAEQHAQISSYDWRKNELSASQIAVDAQTVTDEEAEAILMNEPEITQDYVTSDGRTIPAVYIALRNRLLRVGQGVGCEVHDNTWDFLMQEFTEDEAAFYLKLPNFAYFTDTEAAEAEGMTVEEAGGICEELSYRGLLNRVTRQGTKYYHVLAFAHGMLEFMMDRYEEDGFVESVFGLCGADYGYQSRNQGSPMYFPIPANQEIVGDTEILPNHDWNEIIDRYDTLCVAPCQCRTFTPIRAGEGQKPGEWCDHPMETCVATGEQAQYYIENGIGRQVSKEECREILQRGVDAGMVIEVMCTAECDVICQCHGDCCAILRGFIALDGDVENLHYMSQYELQVDYDQCIKCGSCAARCPLFTIEMADDGPQIGNMCVRCGQCATVCPVGARKLFALPEEERFTMPKDMVDDYHMKALERAKRGYINDFDPAKL